MKKLYCPECGNYLEGGDGDMHDCCCGWKQPEEPECCHEDQSEEIEQLQAKNAELERRHSLDLNIADTQQGKITELTAEVEEQRSDHMKLVEENHGLRQQLAIAEEHNSRLKGALRHCCYSLAQVTGLAKESCDYARWKADQALSLPASREALDKYVAEKVNEARRTAEYWKENHLAGNEQIATLTRQRDLAVEALEKIAAPVRIDGTYNRCREACEILARETLSAIKESENNKAS